MAVTGMAFTPSHFMILWKALAPWPCGSLRCPARPDCDGEADALPRGGRCREKPVALLKAIVRTPNVDT